MELLSTKSLRTTMICSHLWIREVLVLYDRLKLKADPAGDWLFIPQAAGYRSCKQVSLRGAVSWRCAITASRVEYNAGGRTEGSRLHTLVSRCRRRLIVLGAHWDDYVQKAVDSRTPYRVPAPRPSVRPGTFRPRVSGAHGALVRWLPPQPVARAFYAATPSAPASPRRSLGCRTIILSTFQPCWGARSQVWRARQSCQGRI